MPRARALLHAVLGDWGVGREVLESAELVLSELVTNALRVPVPGDRQVGVRITRSVGEGLLRLEVSDAGGGRPEVREPADHETGGRGLLLVAALAHRWGFEERAAGIGKTVYAELKAPDIVVEPVVREVAAVMVRRGEQVRVWGEWRTVVGARDERDPAGAPAVELELDEGPALRVRATEPLAVRQGEGGSGHDK
ncbi:ATP-binding protein [Streptomyces sp. NPDC007264]|uniref:ATP-binding protein n=1 Tax=Streptomyces sp. NPDC007264 TaxID=3364777 RepID=UPI0036D80F06